MFEMEECVRVVGVNDIKFFITQDFKSNRKNIVYKSKQFQQIIDAEKNNANANFEYIQKIQNMFEANKNKLSDVIVEIDGYY